MSKACRTLFIRRFMVSGAVFLPIPSKYQMETPVSSVRQSGILTHLLYQYKIFTLKGRTRDAMTENGELAKLIVCFNRLSDANKREILEKAEALVFAQKAEEKESKGKDEKD
jgi:hypothetical protein